MARMIRHLSDCETQQSRSQVLPQHSAVCFKMVLVAKVKSIWQMHMPELEKNLDIHISRMDRTPPPN